MAKSFKLNFAKAEELKRNFVQQFWCDDLGTYAIALDGAKQPCRVAASNAGHAQGVRALANADGEEKLTGSATALVAP